MSHLTVVQGGRVGGGGSGRRDSRATEDQVLAYVLDCPPEDRAARYRELSELGLTPQAFANPSHGVVWRTIGQMLAQTAVFGIAVIHNKLAENDELDRLGDGVHRGAGWLFGLISGTPATLTSAAEFASIVMQYATYRELEEANARLRKAITEHDMEAVRALSSQIAECTYAIDHQVIGTPETRRLAITEEKWDKSLQGHGRYMDAPAEVEYLVDNLIAKGSLTMLSSRGGIGKSMLAMQLAMTLASGSVGRLREESVDNNGIPRLLGQWSVKEPKRVLYIDLENGNDRQHRRYHMLARAMRLTDDDHIELEQHHRCSMISVNQADFNLMTDDTIAFLRKRLALKYDLIIVDTYAAATPGLDENSRDARAPLDKLRQICNETGVAIMVIAHAKKGSGKGGVDVDSIDQNRGSSAITDALDNLFVLNFNDKKQKVLTLAKQRDGNVGGTEFILESGPGCWSTAKPKVESAPEKKRQDVTVGQVQMEVVNYLQQHHTAVIASLREHVVSALGGRKVTKDVLIGAIQELERAGTVVHHGTGPKAEYMIGTKAAKTMVAEEVHDTELEAALAETTVPMQAALPVDNGGNPFKVARERAGLTTRAVIEEAKLRHVVLSKRSLGEIEGGARHPTEPQLEFFASMYKVPREQFGEEGAEPTDETGRALA